MRESTHRVCVRERKREGVSECERERERSPTYESAKATSAKAALYLFSLEFFTDNLLVRIHLIIVMIRWTGLAPWEFGGSYPAPRPLCSM